MLNYSISKNCITIENSYKITSKKDMDVILNSIRNENKRKRYNIFKRTNKNLINEWRTHNLCYDLHLFRSHTKDVDLDYPQKWYYKLLYGFVSIFYFYR